MAMMVKLHELGFELLTRLAYSLYLHPSDFCFFSDLKKMPILRAKTNRCTTKNTNKLERRWTDCISLKGNNNNDE